MVYILVGSDKGKGVGTQDLIRLSLEIEQSKLNRERSLLMLDKSLIMYFAFLIVGIVGFINGYLGVEYLNVVIILSFLVLASGLIPYMMTMYTEEKRLDALLGSYRQKQRFVGKAGSKKSSRKASRR